MDNQERQVVPVQIADQMLPKACPVCNIRRPALERFCRVCGTKLGSLLCQACGCAGDPGDLFCYTCGMPLTKEAAERVPDRQPEMPPLPPPPPPAAIVVPTPRPTGPPSRKPLAFQVGSTEEPEAMSTAEQAVLKALQLEHMAMGASQEAAALPTERVFNLPQGSFKLSSGKKVAAGGEHKPQLPFRSGK